MMLRTRYAPRYEKSWAVIIGINDYEHTSRLSYAVNDAHSVAALAQSALDFPPANVSLLIDAQATRDNVLSCLHALHEKAGSDDRVLFFFAGHGITRTGHKGEVGYLVPSDGHPTAPLSLIRWDDLTKMAEFVPAKHALFIMDACYGGLAVTRGAMSGSSRFLKDILGRYSRQVLTAGKADQLVSDSGGPRPGNSVFTGHLLEALEGGAADEEGIITATGVMAYVFQRVGRDTESHQTPHYGCIDGDGDFVFKAPPLQGLGEDVSHTTDILVQGPIGVMGSDSTKDEESLAATLKEFLSESRLRIKLDEVVMREVKELLRSADAERFGVGHFNVTAASFAERLQSYESVAGRMMLSMGLLGKWCSEATRPVLGAAISRMSDRNSPQSGNTMLIGLQWYPIVLMAYCGGIGALANKEYENLATILTTRVRDRRTGDGARPVILPMIEGIMESGRGEAFKLLPGHEKHLVPRSEYLFKLLQPVLEDTLFLGNSYEDVFDRFEVFMALAYIDLSSEEGLDWGPPGRFCWKYGRGGGGPYKELMEEAAAAGSKWGPLRAGLFRGDADRFKSIAEGFAKRMARFGWF